MKTGFLFRSIALAAVGLAISLPRGLCQTVGYIPVPISTGYNFVANQFDAGNNTLTNVVSPSSPPLGTAVYLWNVTNQQFNTPSVFSTNGWSTNFNLPPPTAFVVSSPSAWTLTFNGRILQGNFTTYYAGSNKFSLLASSLPISQELAGTNMAFPRLEGENVFRYDPTKQNFSDAFTYYTGYGWFDPDGLASTNGPVINGGESFFAQNLGASVNWFQTYGGSTPSRMSVAGAGATVQSIRVAGGTVTLGILNPAGTVFSVQFSVDGNSWTTLAANQTGTTWRGPLPAGPRGYFRLANP
jgi:hypothetical protein